MIKIGFISLLIILILVIISILLYYQIKWLLGIDTIQTSNQNLDINELNKELEPFGFAYSKTQDFFFSNMNAWQREYGYHKSYDEAAPFLSMIIDCEPITFKYDNKEWLIEFWKGQYGMTTGAEIGIYTSSKKRSNMNEIYYESITDKECIPLHYTLRKKGAVILIRNDRHWWLTGFKLGEFSKPSDLVMDIIISLKNIDMTEAFINGLKNVGYKDKDIRVINNSVYLTFNKPHTKQPKDKNPFIRYIMQKYNKFNCRLYKSITHDYENSLDKLNFIKNHFPKTFRKLLNIGKTKQLFKNN